MALLVGYEKILQTCFRVQVPQTVIAKQFAYASVCMVSGSEGCFKTRLFVALEHSANLQPAANAN